MNVHLYLTPNIKIYIKLILHLNGKGKIINFLEETIEEYLHNFGRVEHTGHKKHQPHINKLDFIKIDFSLSKYTIK